MVFRVFYQLYGRNRGTPASSPLEMAASDMLFDIVPDMDCDGDFVGLIDASGNTLQASYDQKSDHFWVEFPDPKQRGSYGRWVTYEEFCSVLKGLPETFDPMPLAGAEFHSWGSAPPAPSRGNG